MISVLDWIVRSDFLVGIFLEDGFFAGQQRFQFAALDVLVQYGGLARGKRA